MMRAVEDVLEEIGAGERPRLLVLNKADLLDELGRVRAANGHRDGLLVSGATGEGLDAVRERIDELFLRQRHTVELLLPYAEGARLAELHALAGELEREDTPEGVRVRAQLAPADAVRFARFVVPPAGTTVKLPSRAWSTGALLPTRAYEGDAGLDLHAAHEVRLEPGERCSVGTGIARRHPAGPRRPRAAALGSRRPPRHHARQRARPHRRRLPRRAARAAAQHRPRETFTLAAGDRIAQLLVVAFAALAPDEVTALADSERGGRGFGSSG